MERKNTMLLTVIAVATLLVAVVGATFAYYAVTNENNNSTTNVTTTTEKPGVVTLTTEQANLYLKLSNEQMALANYGDYYAKTESSGYATKSANALPISIAKIESTKGTGDIRYNCTFTGTITVSALTEDTSTGVNLSSAYAALDDEDADITLSTSGAAGITLLGPASPATNDIVVSNNTLKVSLKKAKTAQAFRGTVDYTNDKTGYIQATAVFHNLQGTDQKDIGALGLKTEVKLENLTCDTVAVSNS